MAQQRLRSVEMRHDVVIKLFLSCSFVSLMSLLCFFDFITVCFLVRFSFSVLGILSWNGTFFSEFPVHPRHIQDYNKDTSRCFNKQKKTCGMPKIVVLTADQKWADHEVGSNTSEHDMPHFLSD